MVTLFLLALTSSLLLCPDSSFASYQEQPTEVPKASPQSLAQDSQPLPPSDTGIKAQTKKKTSKARKKKSQRKKSAQQQPATSQSQETNDQSAISTALNQARTTQQGVPAQENAPVVAADFAPRPLKERYTIVPGSFLRQLRSFCGQAGWQLIWEAKRDLEINSTASYIAPFEDALRVIFADLARSGQAFRVTLYKANSVVEVRDD